MVIATIQKYQPSINQRRKTKQPNKPFNHQTLNPSSMLLGFHSGRQRSNLELLLNFVVCKLWNFRMAHCLWTSTSQRQVDSKCGPCLWNFRATWASSARDFGWRINQLHVSMEHVEHAKMSRQTFRTWQFCAAESSVGLLKHLSLMCILGTSAYAQYLLVSMGNHHTCSKRTREHDKGVWQTFSQNQRDKALQFSAVTWDAGTGSAPCEGSRQRCLESIWTMGATSPTYLLGLTLSVSITYLTRLSI